MSYQTQDVPVDGGRLRVGVWEPETEPVGTVVAIHGITASHMCWPPLAQRLADWRVIAPDLRGRGRSNELPGPYGMVQHAADVAAVIDALAGGPVVVAGHSMGGFVTVVLADRHPALVTRVVLVDGGFSFPLPAELQALPPAEVVGRILGPAMARLTMTFPTRDAYLDLYRNHPAFVGHWTPAAEAYVAYDIVGTEPELRAAAAVSQQRHNAVVVDSIDNTAADGPVAEALAHWTTPGVVLRAPRGLMNADPLYPAGVLDEIVAGYPSLRLVEVPDVNHYTIVLGDGADAVAQAVREG